ncbi:MAG TPA: hypothetical protein VE888_06545, partial [Streptosporangiaceae bacterium]|nr:hypothetical protein [Streptosporangiaceae bacterium]
MNLDPVRKIADAVLYEGYILYPYRASSQKNQSRWQFGVVMAPGYAAADPSETSFTRAECVLEHGGQPSVRVLLRFLQVQRRTSGGDTWDEAVECEVEAAADAAALLGDGDGVTWEFTVEGGEDREEDVVRRREPLAGAVTVRAAEVPGPWRALQLEVKIENRTGLGSVPQRREDALPTSLVAAHTIITAEGGKFLSMTDPPEWAAPAVAGCRNEGGWPVLADPDDQVMLSSPIILYDHPELAAESPGELYDGTEIDEILTLRTMALSDDEKAEARATDPRAAALLDRVDSMDPQVLARLHGTLRSPGGSPRPAAEPPVLTEAGEIQGPEGAEGLEGAVPWWDPDADASVSPDTDSVTIGGRPIARGSLVRLRPGARRADAQDMFLVGRIAEVQAVLHDVENNPYLAVSLAGQPDEDLRIAHGRFLYFMPDEVEPY